MKVFLFIFSFLFVSTTLAQKTLDAVLEKYNTRSIPYISVEGLRMLQLNNNPVILDTREIQEYETSHIKGAKLVGYDHFSIDTITAEIPDKNTPIVVYCSLGIRSEDIGEKLKKAGFTNIKNLYGGIFEWYHKDFPIVNKNQLRTDSVHTFSKEWSKWLTKGIKVYKNPL